MVKVAALVAIAATVGSASAFVQPMKGLSASRALFAEAPPAEAPAAPEAEAAAAEAEAVEEPEPVPVGPPMSKSLPFLLEPPNLAGYVGAEAGFDPLRFSDFFDMKWLREAELKNGRVAMLATVGFIVQEFYTWPWVVHVDDSNLGVKAAGTPAMAFMIFVAGMIEWNSNKGKVTMMDMFEDGREAGDLGFDPLGFLNGKSEEEKDLMKYKELKNGRLAMLAIGGMIHHNFVTGEPLF